jgi:glycosyltransferase involved in cell wall biosynthesis
MKIALVTETYPPEVNGVAMTLDHLARGVMERGHDMEVVRPRQFKADKPRFEGRYSERLCTGMPLPGYDGLHFGISTPGRLVTHWRKTRPDVVHVATEGPLGWDAIRAARTLKLPVVSSYHTNFHSYGTHYGFGTLVRTALAWLRHIHNSTLLTFAPSDDVVATLTREKFRNVKLLGRGVDTRLYDPAKRSDELRKSWGAGAETPVAIYVGRVAGEKNIPLAIEAFAAMRNILPELKFVIVGDGPARKKLEGEHPDFIFTGVKRGEELATHYASADAFIFASVTETFGNVVTEAMASGLPVIAYNYAAPGRYVQDGASGRLVSPMGDAPTFIAAAETFARDRVRWREMGDEARRVAMSVSWDAVIESYLCDVQGVLALNAASKQR